MKTSVHRATRSLHRALQQIKVVSSSPFFLEVSLKTQWHTDSSTTTSSNRRARRQHPYNSLRNAPLACSLCYPTLQLVSSYTRILVQVIHCSSSSCTSAPLPFMTHLKSRLALHEHLPHVIASINASHTSCESRISPFTSTCRPII